MIRYLFKRVLEMVPTLFGITLISFLILHLAPGKPTDVLSDFNPRSLPRRGKDLRRCTTLINL